MDAFTQLRKHLHTLPELWDDWLVYADGLAARDDSRGRLLVLEHRLTSSELHGRAAEELRRQVETQTEDWIAEHQSELCGRDAAFLDWHRDLVRGLRPRRRCPTALVQRLELPRSQLLATIELGAPDSGDCPALALYRRQVVSSVIGWIQRAFDGVPVPDESHRTLFQAEAADNYSQCDRSRDHMGRWQDLPDDHLLANQWALPHLDMQGIHYYLPAVMCFDLRHLFDAHPEDSWITESLEYTLQPSTGSLRAYQQARFQLLDCEQRAAVYAFTVVAGQHQGAAAWRRVFEAEAAEPHDDWFALYSPAAQ